MYEDVRGHRLGANRKAEDYIPKVDLNMSWLLGMAFTTAVMSTILSKLLSGRYPWELAEDAGGDVGALVEELLHPRTGDYDDYTGKPVRLTLPTGIKDFEHAYEDPRGYLRSSESSFVGNMLDTWENRDFLGNYVYDPNGTLYQKMAQVLTYNVPKPIAVDNYLRDSQKEDFSRSKAGLFGLTLAPRDLDYTPLEKRLDDLVKAQKTPETPEAREEYVERMKAIRNGEITGPARAAAIREARKPLVLRQFNKLSYLDAKRLYDEYANEDEKRELKPAMALKRYNALRRNPLGVQAADAAEE
jgi:hypothetical protein